MSDQREVEEILDMIGDRRAREVLAAISREPRSAQALAEDLAYAPSTVYGRLDELEKHDLVTSELRIADDGNHYHVYECAFDSTLISLEDDEYDVRIFREENLPDQFAQLWDELSRT